MKSQRLLIATLLIVVLGALSACSINLDRNADGSLNATVSMSEQQMNEELALALDGRPNMKNISADMQNGYINVSGERERTNGGQTDQFSFRLDLGVNDGQLTATISDFKINGVVASDDRITQWNEKIANRLQANAEKHPNRTLESVSVSGDELTMVYRIETPRSKKNDNQ